MEPLNIVLSALSSGIVAKAYPSNTNNEITDVYSTLKNLIKNRFASNEESLLVLDRYETKPGIWKEPLKEQLTTAHIEQDEEIITIARKLISLVKPEQEAMYNLIQNYFDLQQSYHKAMEKQTRNYLSIHFFVITLGLLLFLSSIVAMLIEGSSGILTSLGGVGFAVLMLSVFSFRRYKSSLEKLHISLDQLIKLQGVLSALKVISTTDLLTLQNALKEVHNSEHNQPPML